MSDEFFVVEELERYYLDVARWPPQTTTVVFVRYQMKVLGPIEVATFYIWMWARAELDKRAKGQGLVRSITHQTVGWFRD